MELRVYELRKNPESRFLGVELDIDFDCEITTGDDNVAIGE
jgi:hypothetical protein